MLGCSSAAPPAAPVVAPAIDRDRVDALERVLAESIGIVEALQPVVERASCDDVVLAVERHSAARLRLAREIYDRSDLAANVFAYAIRADVRGAVDGARYAREYTEVASRVWQTLVARKSCTGRFEIDAGGWGLHGHASRRQLLGAPLWPRPFVNGRDDREVADALERFDAMWGAFVKSLPKDCADIATRMRELRARHAPLIRATIETRSTMTDVQEQLFADEERPDRGLEWYAIASPCEDDAGFAEAEQVLFAK